MAESKVKVNNALNCYVATLSNVALSKGLKTFNIPSFLHGRVKGVLVKFGDYALPIAPINDSGNSDGAYSVRVNYDNDELFIIAATTWPARPMTVLYFYE